MTALTRIAPFTRGHVRRRLAIWAGLCVLASIWVAGYAGSWRLIAQTAMNPLRVVDERMVHSWGVLALCLLGLLVKRKAIGQALGAGTGAVYVALGAAIIAGSLLLPAPAALVAGLLGLFAAVFGPAARWPSFLTAVYLVALGVPVAAETWLDKPIGTATVIPTEFILRSMAYPVVRSDQFLSVGTASGDVIRVIIAAACAGPATFGVFTAIFALMAMDVRPSWPATAGLFLLGFFGTWVQNVIRVVYLLRVGYYDGADAMWAAHADSGYLWFIAWYAVFAMIYLHIAARGRRVTAASRVPAADPLTVPTGTQLA
jgi:exosortase/archaeosortase family protein